METFIFEFLIDLFISTHELEALSAKLIFKGVHVTWNEEKNTKKWKVELQNYKT